MITLGLDISTSVVGLAALDDKKIIYTDFIDLRKDDNFWKKVDHVHAHLLITAINLKPDIICVEQPMQRFAQGRTSSHTLSMLMRMNGITCQLARMAFNVAVDELNVNAARKTLGFKKDSSSVDTIKMQVAKYVLKTVPNFPIRQRLVKAGKDKGNTIIDIVTYDIVDAYVIAYAACQTI